MPVHADLALSWSSTTISPTGNFGDYRWVEPQRSSTGEMVYEIGEALGLRRPPMKAPSALYVAICTDTGSFRYECTGSREPSRSPAGLSICRRQPQPPRQSDLRQLQPRAPQI
jgi:hypothetical protein